jgi:hypothetical protein
MKISEILNNYKPVYPNAHDWNVTLAYMLSDPIEKAKIDYLVNVLKSGKTFRKPILLGVAEFDEGTETLAIVDGTHRVCAHMLANVDEVYVMNDEDVAPDDSTSWLSTEIVFKDNLSDENMDFLFDILLSFPLNDDIWMESSVSSMRHNMIYLMWDINLGSFLPEDLINVKVTSLIKDRFPETIFSIKTFIDSEEDSTS